MWGSVIIGQPRRRHFIPIKQILPKAKCNMMYNLPFCGSGPKRNSDQTPSVHGPRRSSLSIACFVRIPLALDRRLFWPHSGNRSYDQGWKTRGMRKLQLNGRFSSLNMQVCTSDLDVKQELVLLLWSVFVRELNTVARTTRLHVLMSWTRIFSI